MSKLARLFLVALLPVAALLTSCNNEAGNDVPDQYFQAFVTLTAITDDGCTFEAQKDFSSDPVTFTSNMKLNNKVYEIGHRYILAYMTAGGTPFESGPVQIYNIFDLSTGTVTVTTEAAIKLVTQDEISANIDLTGKWINIIASAAFNGMPREFGVYADRATVDSEYPQLYIGFRGDNELAQKRYFFGSFDISTVWDKPTCKGVEVHFKLSGVDKTVTFAKPGQGGKPITPNE